MLREEFVAGLRTFFAGGPDRQGGGDGPLVCLLHGYGAHGGDLAGLWRVLDVPREVRFAFPEAPLSLAEVFGFPAYAWWHVDVERYAQLAIGHRTQQQMLRALEPLLDEEPAGLSGARAQVLAWLAALRQRLGLPSNRVVLGGFSQGAMLSVDVALHLGEPLAGLLLLSGALVNRRVWQQRLNQAPPVPRFQSHGLEDPLLPFAVGEALHQFLEPVWPGTLYRFHGGHEISPGVVDEMGRAITAWVGT